MVQRAGKQTCVYRHECEGAEPYFWRMVRSGPGDQTYRTVHTRRRTAVWCWYDGTAHHTLRIRTRVRKGSIARVVQRHDATVRIMFSYNPQVHNGLLLSSCDSNADGLLMRNYRPKFFQIASHRYTGPVSIPSGCVYAR